MGSVKIGVSVVGGSMLVKVALAAVSVLALAGCDQVREAGEAANSATDKASVCLDAVRLAGFYPDLGDPAQAAKDAEQTAKDLTALAEKTGDTTLKQALTDMSDQIGKLDVGDVNADGVASWAQQKADALNTLTSACT